MRETEGTLDGDGLRVAVVVSRFHDDITGGLLRGALATLRERGVAEDAIHVVHVPGALELALATQQVLRAEKPDAAVVLGCVIRGETDHYDFVCAETTRGCGKVALEHDTPVLFGLLTCDTLAQALARSGDGAGNKGAECAEGALRMATLARTVRDGGKGGPMGFGNSGGSAGPSGDAS